jgi:RHS repeat-associated protein
VKGIGSNYYRYDHVSRLTEGTAEYVSSLNHKRQTYAYDTYGNMKTITTIVDGSTSNTQTLSPSASTNRLFNTGTAYDESGNMTAFGGESGTVIWSYTYDGLDMMQSHNNGSRSVRFVYTADDERVAVYDATSVHWTWRLRGLDNKVLRQYRNQGGIWSWQKDWIYRGGALLATDQPSIGVRHFALDHLGTPRAISSSTGALVAAHNYYPFGEEATSETQDAEVMKFTGHERDTEFANNRNSIDYMHARFYSPTMGRFLKVDPVMDLKLATRIPQGWNRYTYVRSNPISFIDPDGRVVVGFTGLTGRNNGSAVHEIAAALTADGKLGPVGVFPSERVDLALAFVLRALDNDPTQPVVIFGHSWGGDAALGLATVLNKYKREVHVLGVFDAQGKWFSFFSKNRSVPHNVNFAINYFQTQERLGGAILVGEPGAADVINILVRSSHTGVDNAVMDHFINLLLSGTLVPLF